MNRSLIISSVLHALLIFITAMSLPFLAKKPLDIPPIVSVELIQIAEKTNIPFAPKAKKIIEKAKTIFTVIDKNSEASLLELKPITGRKHQLRKQLYAIGNPIFGDTKYKLSNSNKGINKNLMLHSYQIKFKINDIKHTYSALLPNYFKKLLKSKRLRFSNLK